MLHQEKNSLKKKSSRRLHIALICGLLVVFSLLITILSIGLHNVHEEPPAQLLGSRAHDFRVEWLQGREHLLQSEFDTFALSDVRGKPLILNFWASWCVSCRDEAHQIEAFWQKHRDQVRVVGVAIQDTKDAAAEFIKSFGKTYILGLDVEGRVAIDYGVSGVPETFFIDASGVIRDKFTGPLTVEMLEDRMKKIL